MEDAFLAVIPARAWRATNPETAERRRGALRGSHARVTDQVQSD